MVWCVTHDLVWGMGRLFQKAQRGGIMIQVDVCKGTDLGCGGTVVVRNESRALN